MKKQTLMFFVLLFFLSCFSQKNDPEIVFARVGDVSLTKKKIERTKKHLGTTKTDTISFIEEWVSFTVLLEEAKREGFQHDEKLKRDRNNFYEQSIVSSFLRTKTSAEIKIDKDEVLFFYKQNKEMFLRKEDEAFVHHYRTEQLNDARFIRKALLRKNKKAQSEIEAFRVESKTIKKGRVLKDFDRAIFQTQEKIIGPIGAQSRHHVFEVVRKYKKNSQRGLDACHDEIYQMLLKEKQKVRSGYILDSLKKKTNIFINTNTGGV